MRLLSETTMELLTWNKTKEELCVGGGDTKALQARVLLRWGQYQWCPHYRSGHKHTAGCYAEGPKAQRPSAGHSNEWVKLQISGEDRTSAGALTPEQKTFSQEGCQEDPEQRWSQNGLTEERAEIVLVGKWLLNPSVDDKGHHFSLCWTGLSLQAHGAEEARKIQGIFLGGKDLKTLHENSLFFLCLF